MEESDAMKLIIGLGNPGKEYAKTRHNIGFMALDNYINENISQKSIGQIKEKFNGLYLKTEIYCEKVIFLKPLSYMNLSGTVVKKYIDYFNIDIDDILVICDDLDLPAFNIKLKYKGGCGGHNGLRNIEENLGTSNYKRLKIGIGNNKLIDGKDYVLGKLSKKEINELNEKLNIVNNIIDDFVRIDFEKVMSKYN